MIIKNGLIHSLEKGFYPDTIYIEETRFANLTSDEKILDKNVQPCAATVSDRRLQYRACNAGAAR